MTPEWFDRLLRSGMIPARPSLSELVERREWEREMHRRMAAVPSLPAERLPEADDDV